MSETVQYWENFYQERERVWSPSPNALLVREVTGLTPGTALDLGCGEGADAVWLAERGWRVIAVDASATALARAADLAIQQGQTDIDWQQHDLGVSFPAGRFDLVSAQFFHSPVALADERAEVLRQAADAVLPGGTLLITGHAGWPTWVTEPPVDIHFPTNADVVAALDSADGDWEIQCDETVVRDLIGPEGELGTRGDHVLRLRRIH